MASTRTASRRLDEPRFSGGTSTVESAVANAAHILAKDPRIVALATELAEIRRPGRANGGRPNEHELAALDEDALVSRESRNPKIIQALNLQLMAVTTLAEQTVQAKGFPTEHGAVSAMQHPSAVLRSKLRGLKGDDLKTVITAVLSSVAQDGNAERDLRAAGRAGARAIYGPSVSPIQRQAIDNLWDQSAKLLKGNAGLLEAVRGWELATDAPRPDLDGYVASVDFKAIGIDQRSLRKLSANVPAHGDGSDPVSLAAKKALLATAARIDVTVEVIHRNGRDSDWETIDEIVTAAGKEAQSEFLGAIGIEPIDFNASREPVSALPGGR